MVELRNEKYCSSGKFLIYKQLLFNVITPHFLACCASHYLPSKYTAFVISFIRTRYYFLTLVREIREKTEKNEK